MDKLKRQKEEKEMIRGFGGFLKEDVYYIVKYVLAASKHTETNSENLIDEAIININKGLNV